MGILVGGGFGGGVFVAPPFLSMAALASAHMAQQLSRVLAGASLPGATQSRGEASRQVNVSGRPEAFQPRARAF